MAYFTGTLLASPIVNGSSGDTYGTQYSVLGVGGYQEFLTIAQRDAIPVNVINGLDYDGLSSGRRRLGMLVYVDATNTTYQLNIPYPTWTSLLAAQKVAALANNANWITYTTGGGGSNQNVTSTIIKFNHGFVVGNAIAFNGGNYVLAIADGSMLPAIGIVSTVYDINTFGLTQSGFLSNFVGLTASTTYYVSDITAGVLTPTEPIILGEVSQPILIATSPTTGWVLPYRPFIITSGGSGSNLYTGQSPAAITVGGISGGTVLTGKTYTQLFEELLVPTLNPILSAPFNGFSKSSPAGSLFEIACSQTINFAATFNQGSISPAYCGGPSLRSGLPVDYNYTGTGLPSVVPSSSLSDNENTGAYITLIGNQSWSGSVSYSAGSQPLNSKGGNYSTPLVSGTTGAISITLEGVYPLFASTVTIGTLTKQPLVSMLTANNIAFSMVAETGGNKQQFEIPNAWTGAPTSRPLIGIQTYNTVSLSWEYQGGTNVTSLTYWNTIGSTETIQGNVINYTKYTYNSTDRSSIQIRLVF